MSPNSPKSNPTSSRLTLQNQQKQVVEVTKSLNTLTASKVKLEAVIAGLNVQLEQLYGTRNCLQEQIQAQEAELDSGQALQQGAQRGLDSLRGQISTLQNEFFALNSDVSSLQYQLVSLEGEREQNLKHFETEKATYEHDITILMLKKQDLEQQNHQQEQVLAEEREKLANRLMAADKREEKTSGHNAGLLNL